MYLLHELHGRVGGFDVIFLEKKPKAITFKYSYCLFVDGFFISIMQQIYHPYYNWECFKNGMYSDSGNIEDAIRVLSDDDLFDFVLNEVIIKWSVSAENHLTNKFINRHAWCGQVACSYSYKVGEVITRKAWSKLKDIERYKANKIATKHIKNYERTYRKLHKGLGIQMLQKRNTRRSSDTDKSTRKSPIIQTDLFGYS